MSTTRGIFDSFPNTPATRSDSPFAVVNDAAPAAAASPFTAVSARSDSPFTVVSDAKDAPPSHPAIKQSASPFQVADAAEGFGFEAAPKTAATSPFEVVSSSPFAPAASSPFSAHQSPAAPAASPFSTTPAVDPVRGVSPSTQAALAAFGSWPEPAGATAPAEKPSVFAPPAASPFSEAIAAQAAALAQPVAAAVTSPAPAPANPFAAFSEPAASVTPVAAAAAVVASAAAPHPFASVTPAPAATPATPAPAAAVAPAPAPVAAPAPAAAPVSAFTQAAKSAVSAHTASPDSESDSFSIRQLELRAIFGVDREMTKDEILQRARALPGMKSIARVGPQDMGAIETLKNLLPNLGFGSGALKLFAGSVPLEFIREGPVLLAVQTDGGFAPGVRETLMLVARELGRLG
jgi:hypothetical protein